MAEKDPAVRDLLRAGNKIAAIRLYRERYGGGLADVIANITELEVCDGVTVYVSDADLWEKLIDSSLWEAVETRLQEGNLIAAIKLYREKCPGPLKNAKRMVLALRSLLGLESPSGNRRVEEPVDTFDIRWNCTIHPEKRILFWKEAEAFLEVRFELQISESTISDNFAVSLWDLAASIKDDGEFGIFTCWCGDMGCGGFTAIEIVHLEGQVLWYDTNDWTNWHLFDQTQYGAAISRFEAALVELPQRYPGLLVKFFCDFNKVNSLTVETLD